MNDQAIHEKHSPGNRKGLWMGVMKMMTVRKFLGMMMVGCSTVDVVVLQMRGVTMKELSRMALRQDDYFGFRDDHVLSFEVHDRKLVLNLRPTF